LFNLVNNDPDDLYEQVAIGRLGVMKFYARSDSQFRLPAL
jgi:hypothetical protein